MIRKATSEDAQDCVNLIYLATSDSLLYTLVGDEMLVKDSLKIMFLTPGNLFSREHFWVDENHGRIRGVVSMYPGRNDPALRQGIRRCAIDLGRRMGLPRLLRSALRASRLSRVSPSVRPDEFFINLMAVYPDFQQHGVAIRLMQLTGDLCLQADLHKNSGFVGIGNIKALRLCARSGFKIEATHERARFRKHGVPGLYKVIREVQAA